MFLLRQVHRWLGLAVCLFMIGQGVTGIGLLWKDEWLRALVPEARAPVVSTPESFAAVVHAVEKIPGVHGIEFAYPGLGMAWLFTAKGGIYVDQQGHPVANQAPGVFEHDLASFHAYLLLEHGLGGPIVVAMGLSLIFLSLSGLIVWTSYRRASRRRFLPSSLRRGELLSLHRDLGVISGLFILYTATLGFGLAVRPMIMPNLLLAGGKKPPLARHAPVAPVSGGDVLLKQLRALKAHFPDGTPTLMSLHRAPGAPILVTLRHGETYSRGYTAALVAPNGKVTSLRDSRTQPALMKAYDDFHLLHSGERGNLAYKSLLTLIGLSLVTMGFTGGTAMILKLAADVRRRPSSRGRGADDAPLRLRVVGLESVTARVRRIELASADGSPLPPFTAGAHINIRMPGGLVRSYSLLNSPSESDRYVIGVLREQESRGGSAWMHEALAHGMEVEADPPANNFALDRNATEHLLIAGGIGITPILSMASTLAEQGARYRLLYCTRTRQDAAFADLIEARFGNAVEFIHDDGVMERGLDVSARLAERAPGTHLYVCGPRGLIEAVREAARDWPDGTVHFELFSADRSGVKEPRLNAAFDVELVRSATILHVPADRSLLDVLNDNGVRVKSVCREGICGTCKTRVLSGMVDHRDECLSSSEQADWMEVCVSRAQPGERLLLDL